MPGDEGLVNDAIARFCAMVLDKFGAIVELEQMDEIRAKFGPDVEVRGYLLLEGHIAYREFFVDASQIEKRPAVLLLPGWLWDGFYADQKVTVSGVTYRVDEPLMPVDIDDTVAYFGALCYRY